MAKTAKKTDSRNIAVKTAQDPVKNPEIISVANDTDQVACDGGNPLLGHPLTYYTFDGADFVECGYCDRRFVRGRPR